MNLQKHYFENSLHTHSRVDRVHPLAAAAGRSSILRKMFCRSNVKHDEIPGVREKVERRMRSSTEVCLEEKESWIKTRGLVSWYRCTTPQPQETCHERGLESKEKQDRWRERKERKKSWTVTWIPLKFTGQVEEEHTNTQTDGFSHPENHFALLPLDRGAAIVNSWE